VKYLIICCGLAIPSLVHTGAAAHESATEAYTRSVSERTKAEAARPYRWIVEASKKPRPPVEQPPATERKPAPQRRAVERDAVSEVVPYIVRPQPQGLPAAAAASQPVQGPTPLPTNPAAPISTGAVSPDAPIAEGASPSSAVPEEPGPDVQLSDEPIFTVEPDVPPEILDSLLGAEVTATIRLEIEPSGAVSRASVLRASNPRVRQYLLEAVRQWRYPPTAAGRRLEIQLRLAV